MQAMGAAFSKTIHDTFNKECTGKKECKYQFEIKEYFSEYCLQQI